MPYRKTSELPDNVRNVLPLHAQRIYMSVYNDAMHDYDNPSRVAWGVVRKHYRKSGDRWVKKYEDEFSSTTDDSD